MNKAFMREDVRNDEEDIVPHERSALADSSVHYMTLSGHRALREEFERLVRTERPALVQVVSWAAGNGDRSENGDYIYGKKRLREIDRRIRYLTKRLDGAVVIDPAAQENPDQVFFGATVILAEMEASGSYVEATYQIVGVDEANPNAGCISWKSPLAQALLKAREGDQVRVHSPAGIREIEIIEIFYR